MGFAAGAWCLLVSKKENGAELYERHSTSVHMGTARNPGWQTLNETKDHFCYKGSLVPSFTQHGLIFGRYTSYTRIIYSPPQCERLRSEMACHLGVCMRVNHTEI